MIGAFVLGKAQKYKLPWRLLIVSFGAGCVLLALEIIWFRFLRLIGLTREDYPEYHDYLSITFSKVKQKPRVVEEHDSMAGILSSVEAGTGVARFSAAFLSIQRCGISKGGWLLCSADRA